MKHVLVFVALGLAIYILAIKKSDLDLLTIPATNYSEVQVGNRFVDIEPSELQMTPKQFSVPGVTTVVYFHDDKCSGCLQLDQSIPAFLVARPDVAIRKVRMELGSNGYSKAIKKYQWPIYMAPTILIFDKNSKLIAADEKTDSSGQDLLEKWITRELEKIEKKKW